MSSHDHIEATQRSCDAGRQHILVIAPRHDRDPIRGSSRTHPGRTGCRPRPATGLGLCSCAPAKRDAHPTDGANEREARYLNTTVFGLDWEGLESTAQVLTSYSDRWRSWHPSHR